MEIAIVFPHQIFEDNPAIEDGRTVWFIEDHLFFTQYPFHKQKLVLHRASMKYYKSFLENRGLTCEYVAFHEHQSLDELFEAWAKSNVQTVYYVDTVDYLLERRLKRYSKKHDVELKQKDTPTFLTTPEELDELMKKNRSNSYFMADFYKKQRERLDILIDNGEPTGGKWSFDEENRKKLPKNHNTPSLYAPQENEFVREAKEYVEKHFSDNYGSLEGFRYPVNFYQAKEVLDDFLENRMHLFGDYEDAISANDHFLYHSVLTPALNTGLLTPRQILDRLFTRHEEENYPLNSLEGFVRQIIGWREFMRGVYIKEGVYERKNNFFKHTRKIPHSFWEGNTGITPIDTSIKKLLKTAYNHHIERLMLFGNFMLLCEFDPDEIYEWFMTLYIDAYDWVMVPNVYGMTQYADGGLITTKPYISGSNYVKKMSDYGKGPWNLTWDSLYWRFVYVHQDFFKKNQRMGFMVSTLNRMDSDKREKYLDHAASFLKKLSKQP